MDTSMKKKITRWDAELSLKLLARGLAKGYSDQFMLELMCDISKYIKDSNLPTVREYYNEAVKEIKL